MRGTPSSASVLLNPPHLLFYLPSCENEARLLSPDAGMWILDIPDSKTVRNKSLFSINYPVSGTLL